MVTAVGVDREIPTDPPLDAASEGIVAFGHALHGQVGGVGDNAVLSPLSVAYAFAMARAGAEGTTAEEIDGVLRFPEQGLHAAFNALDRAIVTQDAPPPQLSPSETRSATAKPEPPVVAIANGLFVQHQFQVRRDFLETLAANYGVGIGPVDFTDPPAAKRTIDAWVREHTADRIEELFSGLDPKTRLVLANAIYLKADWETPFLRDTETTTFTRTDGSRVQVPLMHDRGRRRYATGDGWKAVELLYAGGELAMWVILPDDPARVLDATSPQRYEQLAERLTEGEVEIFLPRFDIATNVDLRSALQPLGMHTPFGPAADFSAISPEPLFIRDAVHRANITVDEYGTEAAAVTGLAFAVSEPPPPELTLRADRPFVFMITHLPTDTPVFIGHVADPSTTSG